MSYPTTAAARDRFVLERRPPRPTHDPWQSQGVLVEDERSAVGAIERVATLFLTGRECPWRCVMCDLWRHTTVGDTPRGATAAQVAAARRTAEDAIVLKLYNAGSFFDPRAVPEDDYATLATALDGLARVIVESHPSLVGPRLDRWLDVLDDRGAQSGLPAPAVEVAMGLETAHPDALERLNKRMTIDDFSKAARELARRRVGLRVFLLVSPPFVPAVEQDEWLLRSIDAAWECSAAVVSLIPTRGGNGALEALADEGLFQRPHLTDLERSFDAALGRPRPTAARVFADLWDLDQVADCRTCVDARRARLHAMNLDQSVLPPVDCRRCGSPRAS